MQTSFWKETEQDFHENYLNEIKNNESSLRLHRSDGLSVARHRCQRSLTKTLAWHSGSAKLKAADFK